MEAEAWVGAHEFRAESTLAPVGLPPLVNGAARNGSTATYSTAGPDLAESATPQGGHPEAPEHGHGFSLSEFVLDHRGVGIATIVTDLFALVLAAVGAVVAEQALRPTPHPGWVMTVFLTRLLFTV